MRGVGAGANGTHGKVFHCVIFLMYYAYAHMHTHMHMHIQRHPPAQRAITCTLCNLCTHMHMCVHVHVHECATCCKVAMHHMHCLKIKICAIPPWQGLPKNGKIADPPVDSKTQHRSTDLVELSPMVVLPVPNCLYFLQKSCTHVSGPSSDTTVVVTSRH